MSDAAPTQGPILILSGAGPYARVCMAVYRRRFAGREVIVVVERPNALPKLIAFAQKRIRQRGLGSFLDALALRVVHPGPKIGAPELVGDLEVTDANDPGIAELARKRGVSAVLLNICSLLNKEQIARIGVPIVNVHNGVTPRYRGAGNIWALAENQFDLIGATVHAVDAGVDTGGRLAVASFDPVAEGLGCEEVEQRSFALGAEMAAEYLLTGRSSIPKNLSQLEDGYYPYPGLSDWRRAKAHFRRRQRAAGNVEAVWRESFRARARDAKLARNDQLHWSDGSTIEARNKIVADLTNEAAGDARRVLDVGCGDARLRTLLRGDYFGVDFSQETLRLSETPGVAAASADALPFARDAFDAIVAAGLYQHLEGAQAAADEMRRVVRPGGAVVINTLRQFSKLELTIIAAASIFHPSQLRLIGKLWRGEFGGTGEDLVARRYSRGDLQRLFRGAALSGCVYHRGLFGGPLFAREITVRFTLPARRRAATSAP